MLIAHYLEIVDKQVGIATSKTLELDGETTTHGVA